MAFYKKSQLKSNGLWYPRSIVVGDAATTDEVAQRLADISTVSLGDTYNVLKNLSTVLKAFMKEGRSVKLDGVGTFYYTANTEGKGVDTAKEVGAQQIAGTRVRFIPEVSRGSSGQITTRSLVAADAFWELLDELLERLFFSSCLSLPASSAGGCAAGLEPSPCSLDGFLSSVSGVLV